jgi:hypothetical protein
MLLLKDLSILTQILEKESVLWNKIGELKNSRFNGDKDIQREKSSGDSIYVE